MKVLMINGSPDDGGCIRTALGIIADALKECGVESETVNIGKKPISGCIACGQCRKSGSKRCAINNDIVNGIIEKAENADGLIVGSPVYYASPNGSIVSLLDRMFYAHGGYPHKPAAAIASARRAGTIVTVDELNKYFTISQMPVVSSTYWNEVHGSRGEDVFKDGEGVATMRNLAYNMAWLLKCIECGKANGILPPDCPKSEKTNFIR